MPTANTATGGYTWLTPQETQTNQGAGNPNILALDPRTNTPVPFGTPGAVAAWKPSGSGEGAGGMNFASLLSGMGAGAGAGGGGALVKYTPGPITSALNDLFTAALTGKGAGSMPAAQTLYNLSAGKTPPAIAAQYAQNLEQQKAQITEGMGVMGNRFGTDLARTLMDAAGRSGVNLSAEMARMAADAASRIGALGTSASQLEFTGDQAALDRAHQDYMLAQQADLMMSQLIPLLIGAGSV